MSDRKITSALRRQLLENGFTPLANKDKACFLENWPRLHVDDGIIKRWSRMLGASATGIRRSKGTV